VGVVGTGCCRFVNGRPDNGEISLVSRDWIGGGGWLKSGGGILKFIGDMIGGVLLIGDWT
jgi:hypothetical protein